MTGVPELVDIFDKWGKKTQIRPFMYKYYLILCFCIEESDTWDFLCSEQSLRELLFLFFSFFFAKILITIICCT